MNASTWVKAMADKPYKYDVIVSIGGLYTLKTQVFGQNQQQASDNAINSYANHYPMIQLTVVDIREVPDGR